MKHIAKVFVYNRVGQVLVLTRSDTHPLFALHYDLPGGEVENNESIFDVLSREVDEETGLKISNDNITVLKTEQTEDNLIHSVGTVSLDEDQEVKLSWEHSSYEWVNPKHLLKEPLPVGVDKYYLFALRALEEKPFTTN